MYRCLFTGLVDQILGLGETGKRIGICRFRSPAGNADDLHFAAPFHRLDHRNIIFLTLGVGPTLKGEEGEGFSANGEQSKIKREKYPD